MAKEETSNRSAFLKKGALFGISLLGSSALRITPTGGEGTAGMQECGEPDVNSQTRALGSGSHRIEVSAFAAFKI